MALSLEEFKSKFGGGVRTNLYEIVIPSLGDLSILAKASTLPNIEVGKIDVNYAGRILPVPGDRAFAEWACTIYADEDLSSWKKLKEYHEKYNGFESNTGSSSAFSGEDIVIKQLKREGEAIVTFTLKNAWCSSVGGWDVSADNRDAIAEYSTTWQYSHYTIA